MLYDYRVTGRVIQELRRKKELTQEVLSGLAGIPRGHLGMIETGTVNPTVDTLWKISEALGIKMSELFKKVEQEMGIRG